MSDWTAEELAWIAECNRAGREFNARMAKAPHDPVLASTVRGTNAATRAPEAGSSDLASAGSFAGVAQPEERQVSNLEVAGSKPAPRSTPASARERGVARRIAREAADQVGAFGGSFVGIATSHGFSAIRNQTERHSRSTMQHRRGR